jgi:hypothetical protein
VNQQEAIRHACETVSLAYHSIGDYNDASDGFCDKCPHNGKDTFRNGGHVLRYVRFAVLEKLKRDGYRINDGFDQFTGDPK